MMNETNQAKAWNSGFGEDYTRRNQRSLEELEGLYVSNFGVGRRKMNEEIIGSLPRTLRILEVGSNIGNQLLLLREMGFKNIFGIDVQLFALKKARQGKTGLCLAQASAPRLPFPDGSFDLVFTSGVLIHIRPENLPPVLSEIHRCSSGLIWGFEYYDRLFQQVPYRGHGDLLWKGDFARLYRDRFPDLSLVAEKRYPYTKEANTDTMFLLKKSRA